MTQKAAKQQAAADQAAKDKAAQAAAAATAEQIQAKKQADYAKNSKGTTTASANCAAADGGQIQTATDVQASGFNRGGTIGPVTSEGGRKGKCS